MPAFYRSLTAGLLLVLALLFTACASSDATVCSNKDDCESNSICVDEKCEEVGDDYCADDQDCDGTDFCSDDNVCVPEQANTNNDNNSNNTNNTNNSNNDNNSNNNNTNNSNNDNNSNNSNNTNNDNNSSQDNPSVEAVTPDDGTLDVSLDTEIRITFDQPIDENFSLSTNAVSLRTSEGATVSTSAEYFADEREIVLTPNEPLWEATRYTVHVTSSVINPQGFPLMDEVESFFITEWEADSEHAILAEWYSPVIYQETLHTDIPDVHADIPTRLDFDGNFDANDNMTHSRQSSAELPAHVHYSVSTTETHYFIHYILYYATRRIDEDDYFDHDFTGVLVVVNQDTMEVELVDGVHIDESSTYDERYTYRPDGSIADPRTEYYAGRTTNFSPSQFEEADGDGDQTHFPLYVPSGEHAGCFWHNRDASWCSGSAGNFIGGNGVVLRAGDQAQTYDEAAVVDDEHLEMEYGLRPFIDPFWTMAGDSSCGPFSLLTFTYEPTDSDDHGRPTGRGDEAAELPRSLCSSDNPNFATLPYRWLRTESSSGGVWFLDPAWYLHARYDFGDDYSLDYCYNFYFGIDRRDEPECGGE